MEPRSTNRRGWDFVIAAVLVLAVLVTFWPVVNCGFVDFDDNVYVTENPRVQAGLTLENLRWASYSMEGSNYWHPLTWLSHMLDYELYGPNPAGHHATNLLLHIAGTLALFFALRRLTGSRWRSAFVAALFGLHPLHVEPVAWVAQRKEILCGLFTWLTLWAYAGYVQSREQRAKRKEQRAKRKEQRAKRKECVRGWYAVTLLLFVFGLASKPMIVSLPFVLLLLDYWPLGRFAPRGPEEKDGRATVRHLVLEKMPFLLAALAIAVVTYLAGRDAETLTSAELLPPLMRVLNGCRSYGIYLLQTFYPYNLAVYHVHPGVTLSHMEAGVALLVLGAITLLVVRFRTRRYLPMGWAWFVVMLVPVSGLFVQNGAFAYADRYTYLPLTGVFIMLVWGLADLMRSVESRAGLRAVRWRWLGIVSGLTVLALLAVVSHGQVRVWTDTSTLFTHAVNVTSDNYLAHDRLGFALAKAGQHEEAEKHFREVIRIAPEDAGGYNNLASLLLMVGRYAEARSALDKALELRPGYVEALNNAAIAAAVTGDLAGAMLHLEKALSIEPDSAQANAQMGMLLAQQGRRDDAIRHLAEALKAKPDWAEVHNLLDQLKAEPQDEREHSVPSQRRGIH